MFETPVAVFCFNRPAEVAQLLKILEAAKPKKLLFVSDGPRRGVASDVENCKEVQALIHDISWPCTVLYNSAPENLGLITRFSTGLRWIFQVADRAIILEDDCHPDLSFFPFAEEMLHRYELSDQVGMIQGWSTFKSLPIRRDFYLTRRPKIWGWATWRKVVEGFDIEIPFWNEIDKIRLLRSRGYSRRQAKILSSKIDSAKQINTWDYQWVAYLLYKNLQSISPRKSLIRNIGFGENASHTKSDFGGFSQRAFSLLPPFSAEPASVLIGKILDRLEPGATAIRMILGLDSEAGCCGEVSSVKIL